MSHRESLLHLSAGTRYRLLRWTLVQLRRLARRYSINFDNAVESSTKDGLDDLPCLCEFEGMAHAAGCPAAGDPR